MWNRIILCGLVICLICLTDQTRVFCEMLVDGGWTVFQRRSGAEVLFNKKWAKYEQGFGNLQKDHWLGLSKVFALTKGRGRRWTMRVDLWDFEGGTAFAEYSDFRLGTEKESYKLNVGAYRGNAGDAIRGNYTERASFMTLVTYVMGT